MFGGTTNGCPSLLGEARAWIFQGIHSFQFLKLCPLLFEGECTDHRGEPWPKVRVTHEPSDPQALQRRMKCCFCDRSGPTNSHPSETPYLLGSPQPVP